MKKGIIYEWRNKLDGKFYVGQTIHPKRRYDAHVKAIGDSLFHRAIRKHGIENFEYSVVATYEHETEQGLYDLLNEAEKERIKFRNSLAPNGYNVADGGKNGNAIAGFTEEEYEEFCKKVKEAQKQYYIDNPEAMRGENHPMYGKKPQDFMTEEEIEEWRKNISIALLKFYIEHPEVRVLLSEKSSGENNGFYGKHHSDEICALISEKNSGENNGMYGKHHSDEICALISKKRKQYLIEHPEAMRGENNPMYGKKPQDFMTPEEIEEWYKNISIALKEYYKNNPEARALLSERMSGENNPMFGKHHSNETCALISEKNSGENSGWYGKHWYNNGINEQPYFDGEQPEGWVRGRLKKKSA